MVCLVTGGAGFIGSHLVDLLLENGHDIVVLDNLSTGKRENLPEHKNLTFIEGDILDKEVVASLISKAEYVFHLAAVVSVELSVKKPEFSKIANIDGSFNIIDIARHNKNLKNLFFASSAATYGDIDVYPLTEDARKDPSSPYGLEKLIMEDYLRIYHKIYGLPWVAGRFFNVYGSRQDPKSPYSGVITKFFDMINDNKPLTIFGTGKQTRDFIHVSDIVQNIYELTINTAPINRAINIGTGAATSVQELAEMVLSLSPNKLEIEYHAPRDGDVKESCSDITLLKQVVPHSVPKKICPELLRTI